MLLSMKFVALLAITTALLVQPTSASEPTCLNLTSTPGTVADFAGLNLTNVTVTESNLAAVNAAVAASPPDRLETTCDVQAIVSLVTLTLTNSLPNERSCGSGTVWHPLKNLCEPEATCSEECSSDYFARNNTGQALHIGARANSTIEWFENNPTIFPFLSDNFGISPYIAEGAVDANGTWTPPDLRPYDQYNTRNTAMYPLFGKCHGCTDHASRCTGGITCTAPYQFDVDGDSANGCEQSCSDREKVWFCDNYAEDSKSKDSPWINGTCSTEPKWTLQPETPISSANARRCDPGICPEGLPYRYDTIVILNGQCEECDHWGGSGCTKLVEGGCMRPDPVCDYVPTAQGWEEICTVVPEGIYIYHDADGDASNGCEEGCGQYDHGSCSGCYSPGVCGEKQLTCWESYGSPLAWNRNNDTTDGCEIWCQRPPNADCDACPMTDAESTSSSSRDGCTHLASCYSQWFDADGDAANGCEANCKDMPVPKDLHFQCFQCNSNLWFGDHAQNSGQNSTVPPLESYSWNYSHANISMDRTCEMFTCDPGWYNIDLDINNGCEVFVAEGNATTPAQCEGIPIPHGTCNDCGDDWNAEPRYTPGYGYTNDYVGLDTIPQCKSFTCDDMWFDAIQNDTDIEATCGHIGYSVWKLECGQMSLTGPPYNFWEPEWKHYGCESTCAIVPGAACTACNASGTCQEYECDPGRFDFDGNATNGCEGSCLTDIANGDCLGCKAANTCDQGVCDANWFDTDQNATNGCEGTCFEAIANGSCDGCAAYNTCDQVVCNANFFDTDGDFENGCESGCPEVAGGTCSSCQSDSVCDDGGLVCDSDRYDADGDPSNGCEASCGEVTVDGGVCTACTKPEFECMGPCPVQCTKIECNPNRFDTDGEVSTGCEDGCPAVDGGACSQCDDISSCGAIQCDANRFDDDGIHLANGCEAGCPAVAGGTCLKCKSSSVCNKVDCEANMFDTDNKARNGCEEGCDAVPGGTCTKCSAQDSCDSIECGPNSFDADEDASNGCESGCLAVVFGGTCTECPTADTCTALTCNANHWDADAKVANGCETIDISSLQSATAGTGVEVDSATQSPEAVAENLAGLFEMATGKSAGKISNGELAERDDEVDTALVGSGVMIAVPEAALLAGVALADVVQTMLDDFVALVQTMFGLTTSTDESDVSYTGKFVTASVHYDEPAKRARGRRSANDVLVQLEFMFAVTPDDRCQLDAAIAAAVAAIFAQIDAGTAAWGGGSATVSEIGPSGSLATVCSTTASGRPYDDVVGALASEAPIFTLDGCQSEKRASNATAPPATVPPVTEATKAASGKGKKKGKHTSANGEKKGKGKRVTSSKSSSSSKTSKTSKKTSKKGSENAATKKSSNKGSKKPLSGAANGIVAGILPANVLGALAGGLACVIIVVQAMMLHKRSNHGGPGAYLQLDHAVAVDKSAYSIIPGDSGLV